MDCPDCKIPMNKITQTVDKQGNIVEFFLPIHKCPRCKMEKEEEE